jgi:galactokinase
MTDEPRRVVEELAARFGGGRESVRVASAPGRVNLIGGHTDYNEGHVLPVAIDQRLATAVRPTDGEEVRVHSLAYDEQRQFPVADIGSVRTRDWLAYVHGVLAVVSEAGYERLGELMFESPESLGDEYAVSCGELDAVVDIAARVDGVPGARMTGAGFGGSVVTLVEPDSVDPFRETVHEEYPARTGVEPDCYVATPDDGARDDTPR